MRRNRGKNLSLCLRCTALIVAMALFMTGCGSGTPFEGGTGVWADGSRLGEGSISFELIVTDRDGEETRLEIRTDQETVGGALLELELIAGEESEYGLFVKTVNGITADYDTDGVYWAFYVDGEYAAAGVDITPVTEGSVYSFKVE